MLEPSTVVYRLRRADSEEPLAVTVSHAHAAAWRDRLPEGVKVETAAVSLPSLQRSLLGQLDGVDRLVLGLPQVEIPRRKNFLFTPVPFPQCPAVSLPDVVVYAFIDSGMDGRDKPRIAWATTDFAAFSRLKSDPSAASVLRYLSERSFVVETQAAFEAAMDKLSPTMRGLLFTGAPDPDIAAPSASEPSFNMS